ncbi:hypothetical protein CspHIS471_0411620 [Cutaneotrichosporon sp. HIS471]|nr:hypothetical protein CspHIS471_0411620 [Cutaneotrichosporon sp. HIS471]
MRLSTDELACPLLVPFLRQVPSLDVLQVSHVRRFFLWRPQAIASHTVILGTVGGNVCSRDVPFSDPGVCYTPSLRKVVFNYDAEKVLHFDRVLEPLYPSHDGELVRDCLTVRMMVQLAHPVQFVLIFHPVPEIARNRLRAIVCKALYLAIIHDVRVLFVNTVVLPSSMFPFTPSDPVLGVDGVSSFPEEARRVGSALQSLQTFAQTCVTESDRVTFCTMDEYRERVGNMRFEEETYADSDVILRRQKYQKLWEKARRNRRDTFEDQEGGSRIRNRIFGLGIPGLSAAAPAAAQAAPAPPPAAPAPVQANPASTQTNSGSTRTNPTSAVGNPSPVPANAAASSLDSTSQRRWGTLRFRSALLENIAHGSANAGSLEPPGYPGCSLEPPSYSHGPPTAISGSSNTSPAPTNTTPAPASVTLPSPQLSLAAMMASVNLDQALVQALASLAQSQSQSTAREARGNTDSGSRDDEQQ